MGWIGCTNVILSIETSKHLTCLYLNTINVADYGSSIGVVGIGLIRVREIVQAYKDQTLRKKMELFSKEANVHSFGMTCYEILIEEVPFEDHSMTESYNHILSG